MKLTIEKSVCVITPTIGSPTLADAIRSVDKQTYKNLRHLIVVDGPDFEDAVYKIIPTPPNGYNSSNINVTVTPNNTGARNFYGHRIYAAYPHLLDEDYILFLDEDNFYDDDHVETLVEQIEKKDLDFSYSLRQIYSKEGKYLCDDNCESLGKWPIYFSRKSPHGPQYLIDTSSFCFKREWLVGHCSAWHCGWGADRNFLYNVKDHAKFETTGCHTLKYRLNGNPNSVTKEFFEEGNKVQSEYYGGNFPWVWNAKK